MWCFFDESYQTANGGVTAIAACLMNDRTVKGLDLVLYDARRNHFGIDHARDLTRELKGASLLSRGSFDQMEKYGNNRNIELTQQVITKCVEFTAQHPIWLFGAVVYGEVGVIKKLGTDRLVRPVADILDKVSAAAARSDSHRRVNLVFDSQICGAEPDIAAAVRKFVAGVRLHKISIYPLVGVSHVSPGIQLADICAYILGRKAIGDERFDYWLQQIRQLEWHGSINCYPRSGIQRWHLDGNGRPVVCHNWKEIKELDGTGQAPARTGQALFPTPQPQIIGLGQIVSTVKDAISSDLVPPDSDFASGIALPS
ncbi:MAG: DUF3800 domain-containing protein [Planctomycetaceae bacterium]|nr:DUF3800 domain-containing protein [Planctomycetaceae bacterium]